MRHIMRMGFLIADTGGSLLAALSRSPTHTDFDLIARPAFESFDRELILCNYCDYEMCMQVMITVGVHLRVASLLVG